jgi:hypothetical protein
VSKLVDSDARPRPTTGQRRGGLRRRHRGADARGPPRVSDTETVAGAQEIFTTEIPYRKYFLGPGSTPGGRRRHADYLLFDLLDTCEARPPPPPPYLRLDFPDLPATKDLRFPFKLPKRGPVISKRTVHPPGARSRGGRRGGARRRLARCQLCRRAEPRADARASGAPGPQAASPTGAPALLGTLPRLGAWRAVRSGWTSRQARPAGPASFI